MRSTMFSVLVLALAAPLAAQDTTITIRAGRDARGQDRLEPRSLPRDVAAEVIRLFNDPATVRFSGRTRVPEARGVDGDVVVLGGPVTIAGRVSGRLVVINGDLELEPGALIGGDVIVVGGRIIGERSAEVRGEMRSYREILRYRREGDELVHASERDVLPRWARRRFGPDQGDRSRSDFFLALGGTYNRVEGAPIVFGPRADVFLNDGARFQGEVFGIIRSGRDFSLQDGDIGYRLRGELVFGTRNANLGIGARLYDVVNSVEPWPLKDYESGWGSFLLHRDYRDFFRRRGVSAYATYRPSRDFSLLLEGRDEQHYSTDARDPWTIFRSDQAWRFNPGVSDGLYRSALLSVRLDTRNDRAEPDHGIFLLGEIEAGRGTELTGPTDPTLACLNPPCHDASYADGTLDYRRAFVDARTYLRIAPGGRLALRAAAGGRLGGDVLPLQRRVSVGGPDPLPGHAFRTQSCDALGLPGSPAMCDRVALLQAEYRSHLGFDFGPDWVNDWGDDEDDYQPFHVSGPDIVVFADAGRAWSVGTTTANQIPSNRLPKLSSFLADVGLGIDFGPLGFYLAKAVGRGAADRDVNFTVRMGRRF